MLLNRTIMWTSKALFGFAVLVASCSGSALLRADAEVGANPCSCSDQTFVGGGNIQSPNYPQNYCNNLAGCTYNLQATDGKRVKIVINSFTTEPNFDVLSVYDGGKSEADVRIAALSGVGVVKPGTVLYSGGQLMTLVFKTDNGGAYSGFSITFTSVVDEGCGPANVPSTGGLIQTPNYPYNYPNGISCSWIYQAPTGTDAQISFAQGSTTELGGDFVIVSEDSKTLATYSGTGFKTVQGNDGNLRVTFSSDATLNFPGFQAQDCKCGAQVRVLTQPDEVGTISSPNYGGPTNQYCHNAHCTWYLEVPSGYKVHLHAVHFELEQGFDSLVIDDDLDGALDERCTGTSCPDVTSQSRFLTLKFNSDGSVAKSGFSFQYTAIQ